MVSFLLIAALVAAATAVPTTQNINPGFPVGRIVGGWDAMIDTYPYQISLEVSGRHTCGGSIISANFVLTAGHCAKYTVDQLSIRAGTSRKEKGGSVHGVLEIIRHEKYNVDDKGVPHNDLALLRVKEPFQFDKTCQPINLFNAGEELAAGVEAVITGWGHTGNSMPIRLQFLTLPIISTDLCDKAYKEFGGLPDGQICAGYIGRGGKDACKGDSGGPLAVDGRLAGIVSWGNGCAQADYPSAYTEVAAYREWINEHAEL